jgi:fructose-bisphosphate aldolase class II
MIVSTTELYRHAYGRYALGAYNVNNLEQVMGLFRGNLGKLNALSDAADPAVSAPFILQISRPTYAYSHKSVVDALVRGAADFFADAIFAVNLDHGTEQLCYDCIEGGLFSSVMIDASREPFDENIDITRRVVDRAHDKGIAVEAELGQLGGLKGDAAASTLALTDPGQAAEFIARSGCDSLGVAIGTSHGVYKFAGEQNLRFDVLREIQRAAPPRFPLVLHGSSSVPQAWVQRINNAGGRLDNAFGVNEEQYLPAAKLGVCKVNIDTDGRLVWYAVHRESFRDNPANVDFRVPGAAFMEHHARLVAHKNTCLGSAGQLETVRALVAGLSKTAGG